MGAVEFHEFRQHQHARALSVATVDSGQWPPGQRHPAWYGQTPSPDPPPHGVGRLMYVRSTFRSWPHTDERVVIRTRLPPATGM